MSEAPMVGVFWLVEPDTGGAQLLSVGVPLGEAESYGDCLTFGPGHADVWEAWRRSRELPRAVTVLVRTDDYDDWPRGRVVVDQTMSQFIVYADRKLLTRERLAAVLARFHLDESQVTPRTDLHYRSRFSPNRTRARG